MRIQLIIIIPILLLSCRGRDQKKDDTISIMDSLKDSESVVSTPEEVAISASDGVPQTTALPFTAHYDANHMSELVKNVPTAYKLPSLKKINYIVTDSSYLPTCDDGSSVSTILDFKRYRYKLPNRAHYQVYIVCDTTLDDYTRDKSLHRLCRSHMFYTHAYLLLYDSVDKYANAINIQHVAMGMHGARRTFDIGKNYVIHIQDYGLSSETEDAEEIPVLKQLITVALNGDICIETPTRKLTDEFTGKTISQKPARRTIFSPDGSLKSSSILKQ